MRGDIRHLGVLGDDVFFQALLHGFAQSRLEFQKNFILQDINMQVALDFALGRNKRGVTALAGPQILHIIGHLPVEKFYAICSENAEPASKTKIDDSRRLGQRGVFGQRIAVIGCCFLAVQINEPRPNGLVKLVQ